MQRPENVKKAEGKLAVLLPGMGAVSTTLMAGVLLANKGLVKPIGSLTQTGTIRLGKRTDNRVPRIKDFAPLAKLEDIVFGGWDLFPTALTNQRCMPRCSRAKISIRSKKSSRDQADEGRVLSGVRQALTRHAREDRRQQVRMVEQLRADIRNFIKDNGCSRAVCVWCGSTEVYLEQGPVHQSIASFEKGLHDNDPNIANSMMYAWACLKEGVPFANGAPNLTVDFPRPSSSHARRKRRSAARTSRPARRS
jgi:myo-inositol-1-phosphate synthase